MQLICIECKNDVDLSAHASLQKDQVIECGTCGITLMVVVIDGENVTAEIVDEGK